MISIKGEVELALNGRIFHRGNNLILNKGKQAMGIYLNYSAATPFTFDFSYGDSPTTVNEFQNWLQGSVILTPAAVKNINKTYPTSIPPVALIQGVYTGFQNTESAPIKEAILHYSGGTTAIARFLIPDLILREGDDWTISWRLVFEGL